MHPISWDDNPSSYLSLIIISTNPSQTIQENGLLVNLIWIFIETKEIYDSNCCTTRWKWLEETEWNRNLLSLLSSFGMVSSLCHKALVLNFCCGLFGWSSPMLTFYCAFFTFYLISIFEEEWYNYVQLQQTDEKEIYSSTLCFWCSRTRAVKWLCRRYVLIF